MAGRAAASPVRSPTPPRIAPGGDIAFNFANADLRDVLREVLGEQLQVPYAVDPKLQTTVTGSSGGPVPRSEALSVLDNMLRASGVSLVPSGGVYRAVPIEEAAKSSVETMAAAANRPGYGVRTIPLRFVQAGELKPLLAPFVPPGGVLEADGARNVLLLSGPSDALEGFVQLVGQFDVDWLARKSFALLPLRAGRAKAVADELNLAVGEQREGGGPLSALVRIVPIERLNALLLISAQPSSLRRVKELAERLDFGNDETTPRLFEYRVQNSRAADLARVLTQLFASAGAAAGEPSPGAPALTAPLPVPGGLIQTAASPGGQGGARVPGAATASPIGGRSIGQTIAPKPLEAAAAILSEPIGPGAGPAGDLALPPVRVVADPKANSLVILARPHDYRMIETVLRRLDVVPLQVMLEATIAELTLTDELQYGLQYFLKTGANRFEFSAGPAGNISVADIAGIFPGFNYVFATSNQTVILNLLRSISTVSVLSSPQLLVADNQTAALQVGDQVPIVTQSARSVLTGDASIVNSVEYRSTGVLLQVTPRVNASGLVSLEIDQAVSDVTRTTSSTIDSPTFKDRHVNSSIVVHDGETVALGGLIRENHDDSRSGIPVLSDIPLLGPAFRSTSRRNERTELIVLLTPRVVRNAGDAREVTEDLRNEMRALKPLTRKDL